MNLDALLNPPSFDQSAILTVTPLAPLSMVVQMPGKLFRSQAEPSHVMLYGMLENAMGWYLTKADREILIQDVRAYHGISDPAALTGGRFVSVLQFHVRVGAYKDNGATTVMRYHDLWSQHLKTSGNEFVGGSRDYDAIAIPIMDSVAKSEKDPERVNVNDRASSRKETNAIRDFRGGEAIHNAVLRPYFPRYYVTPTLREYIILEGRYQFRIDTSVELASALSKCVIDPIAPLYLGTNDGWVDVEWEAIGAQPL